MRSPESTGPAPWPFAELTALQQRDVSRMEAALRAGTLPRWPAGMQVFAAAATAIALTACGGGDPEPAEAQRERVPTPPACAESAGACL